MPAVVFGAGPPLGYEAAPDRAVRRLNSGANLRDCSHARLICIGRNQTRLLSLIPVAQVNSGTRTAVIVMLLVGVIWRLQAHRSRWQQYNMVE